MTGFSVDPESINGNSHVLVEIAGLLDAGRLDPDAGTEARAPRAHREVGDMVIEFGRFADDQYRDLTALLGALATRLQAVGEEHVSIDSSISDDLANFLQNSFLPPNDR
ncbi:hypothetical protein HUO13_01845 [Saccharopolyspora erythraea]|uniref:hypothetical protein n=1 Tax=Saccharopolyspora erythraea TaxID=1836 RepID=UPI001BA9F5E0|nr:hypothetical protein [Saccharopolyspora erythraea]QUG99706.1 hypothetical protein HUO13_01845 [Saccharopolyspora erythraea]